MVSVLQVNIKKYKILEVIFYCEMRASEGKEMNEEAVREKEKAGPNYWF